MTPETRRRVLRYGIAVDLVIVATGIGMLLPPMPNALTVAYVAAVALATWKGGWKGGATALVLSALAIAFLFIGSAMNASHLVAFIAAAAAAMAIVLAAQQRRRAREAVPATSFAPERAPNVVSFERDDFERDSRERQKLARSVERAAAEQLHALRPPAPPEQKLPVQLPPPAESAAAAIQQRPAGKSAKSSKRAEKRAREAERRAAEQAAQAKAESERRAALAAEEQSRLAGAAEEAALPKAEEARRAVEEAAQRRIEEERRAAEEAAQRLIEEERRAAEQTALAKAEEERRAVQEAAQRRIEEERRAAAEAADRLIEEERRAAEQAALARADLERRVAEESLQRRIEQERRAADEAAQRLIEEERRAAEQLALARVEDERRAAEQAVERRIEEERKANEAELQKRLEAERQAMREQLEAQLASERAAMQKQADEQLTALRKSAPQPRPKPKTAVVVQAASAVAETAAQVAATLGGLFRRKTAPRSINVASKRLAVKPPPPRRPMPPAAPKRTAGSAQRKPKLLLLERRRGTADTIIPRLRQRGVEAEVVERWVDAVDELFRFRPDALLLDLELADFDKIYRTISEQNASLPILLTGRIDATPPAHVRYAGHLARPYDVEELSRVAAEAMSQPEKLLLKQNTRRSGPVKTTAVAKPQPARTAQPPSTTAVAQPAPSLQPAAPRDPASDEYGVNCFNCRIAFDALEADWCSCLTKERTLVCTNCLTCFCKAPPAYKEKFWVEAPAKVFERKAGEARRQQSGLSTNPSVHDVKRPLVLTVEDDEEIQAIVQRVCSNLGYGFIYATNGQDGLAVAREYKPNLILSDAFMPKLDGREMCRLLKEEPLGDECRMIVMTGLYTDTKYRSEALKRFRVDDYVAKPVAINELISLLQKHLEGVADVPVQDVDLHELHRREIEEADEDGAENGIPLGDLLDAASARDDEGVLDFELPQPKAVRQMPERDEYSVCCFNCSSMFDAVHAEWCSCVGRDQTLVCTACHGCFCKAPAAYKERFWMDAPPSLFERKMIGSKRSLGSRNNPDPFEVKRPLILLVEDDENVQLIVRTVVTSMGFGFIVGANGQEGLALAREYNPDLILSDAFMPKLDGREMCRLLKEDPITARAKAIIMTGLYTDRKYRNEALDYFKVDDYVAKPLAVDDLIKLFKKHLPQEVQATM